MLSADGIGNQLVIAESRCRVKMRGLHSGQPKTMGSAMLPETRYAKSGDVHIAY
jgi:hypothetical protein